MYHLEGYIVAMHSAACTTGGVLSTAYPMSALHVVQISDHKAMKVIVGKVNASDVSKDG